MKRAVVTGGNGYVGSSLVKHLLAEGWTVHAIVNENHQRLDPLLPQNHIHVSTKDFVDAADLVTRLQPDAIFHLAAVYAEPVSVGCIRAMIEANLVLGATLLFAASRCAVAPVFVNTGTFWQFAPDQSYAPNTLYAASKQGFQDILTYYSRQGGLPSTTMVLYDVFGPADDRPKLWNRITRCAPGTHLPLSPGTQHLSLVFIDDVVDAFLIAAQRLLAGEALQPLYSVAAKETISLRDLLQQFNQASRLQLSFGWGELPFWEGVVQRPWVGERLPGWTPRHDVLPSLLSMVASANSVSPKD